MSVPLSKLAMFKVKANLPAAVAPESFAGWRRRN
jgi:hypothetical protein